MNDAFRYRVHSALEGEPPSPDLTDRVLRAVHLRPPGPSRSAQVLMAGLIVAFALGLGASLQAVKQRGLGTDPGPAATPAATSPPSASSSPIHESIDLTRLLVFDSPARMCSAALVMDAVVDGLGPGHWNTPDGSRPPELDKHTLLSKGYQIVTPVRLSRQQILLDRRREPTAELATLGGTAGEDEYTVYGIAQLRPGVRNLIVFSAGLVGGQGISHAHLIANDAFPIDAQELVVLKPRTVEQGQVSEEVRVPLSHIAQQLTACLP